MLFFFMLVLMHCSFIECAEQLPFAQQLLFPWTLPSPFLQVPAPPVFMPSPTMSASQASTPDSHPPDRHTRNAKQVRQDKPYTRAAKTFDFKLDKQSPCDCKEQLNSMQEKLKSIGLQLELSNRKTQDALNTVIVLGEMLKHQSQYAVAHYKDLRKLLIQQSINSCARASGNAQTSQALVQQNSILTVPTSESLQNMVALCTQAAASHLHSAESISAQALVGTPRASREFELPSPLSEQAYKPLQNPSLNLDLTSYTANSVDERKQPVANIHDSMPS